MHLRMNLAKAIVVEPSALLRLGIQQLLQEVSSTVSCDGIDYSRLFKAPSERQHYDLMLLSIPDAYQRTSELVHAAQQGYAPERILLLSDAAPLSFSLHDLPTAHLVGHVAKNTSTAILTAAVNLVLAGGTCFPNPGASNSTPAAAMPTGANATPQRRWYERGQFGQPAGLPPTHPSDTAAEPPTRESAAGTHADPAAGAVHRAPAPPEDISSSTLIQREARMLNLTPRQYEVLALLARGDPIKTISRKLNISISTAKTHTDTLYQRLSVHNGQAAVYEALTRGATLGLSQGPLNQISGTTR